MAVNEMLGWLQDTLTETMGQVAQCQPNHDCCARNAGEGLCARKTCDAEFAMEKKSAPVFNDIDWWSGASTAPRLENTGMPLVPRASQAAPARPTPPAPSTPPGNRINNFDHVFGELSCGIDAMHDSDAGSTSASSRELTLESLETDSTSDWNIDEVLDEHNYQKGDLRENIDELPALSEQFEKGSKSGKGVTTEWYEMEKDDLSNKHVINMDEYCESLPASGCMDGEAHKGVLKTVVSMDDYRPSLSEDGLERTLTDWYETEVHDLDSKNVVSIDAYCNVDKSKSSLVPEHHCLDDESDSAELEDACSNRDLSCCDASLREKVQAFKKDSMSRCELQNKNTPLPTLLGRLGRGRSSCGRSACDKARSLKADAMLHASEDNASMLQSQIASLTRENFSLREKIGELESLQTKLANNAAGEAASEVRQCSELLRCWAATLIQSAERARVARRRAAELQKARTHAKATVASPTGGAAPQKGRGKGAPAPPPPKTGAPGGKGKPVPIKPDVVPSIPLKKLFWNPITLAEAPGDAEHSTVWGKIHQVQAKFDENELESMFADAPSRIGKQSKSVEQQDEKPKPRQVFDEKRRREIWFMMALLPEQNCLADAIVKMDDSALESQKVDLLVSNLPAPSEETMIRDIVLEEGEVWDVSEAFVDRLIAIPQYSLRVQVWGFLNAFPSNFSELSTSHDDLQGACDVLQKSVCIEKMLALILYVGNYLNGGTFRGRADGFDMDTLTKLGKLKSSQKGVTGTLIDFIVEQMEEDHAGTLAELFAPEGGFDILHRARRHKLSESKDGLAALIRQAEEYLQSIDSHAGQDESLTHRREQLMEQVEKLRNLRENFNKLEKRYAELCAWFCFDAGKLKPTDAFFELWDSFLSDVKKSLESFEKCKRAGSKSHRGPNGGSVINGASKSITPSRFLASFK